MKKACNKIDGTAKVKLVVSRLDESRKYVVIVEGDDYKEHFIVEDTRRFIEFLKLEEGDYTVSVASWNKNGGHDRFDVGPVEYAFEVDGCPTDVAVEPTADCESITAVLDTLVDGREYIVKVKDSEGDVVFEKTVWGPTTTDQRFQQDTYTVIVIDVKAKKYGDRNGGWGDHDDDRYDPWKDDEDQDVLVAYNVGDEVPYGEEHADDEGEEKDRNGKEHGEKGHDDRDGQPGKKGKVLKRTATITIGDCEEPPSVEPAGETPDNGGDNGGSWTPTVGGTGGTGGGVLATTGADPAGLALAALILLSVGGAVLATRSVIARRKNAA